MGKITKIYFSEIKEVSEKDLTIEHLVTVEMVDRDKEIVKVEGIDYTNFLRNPVVLWAHGKDPVRGGLPIGKCVELGITELKGVKGLKAKTQFYDDDFSKRIFEMYKEGYLNAWSISFLGEKESKNGVGVYNRVEMLEYSAVPVPANPYALTEARNKGIITYEDEERFEFLARYKKVIPYRRTPLAPEDTEWDGNAAIREADIEDLRIICTWYDEEKPDVKSSYKLPHHKPRKPYHCVWRGVAAAMAALFGARGGVDIPASDWDGCYEHLAKHYADFGKEPPQPKIYRINLEINNFLSKIELEAVGNILSARIKSALGDTLKGLHDIHEEINKTILEMCENKKEPKEGIKFLEALYSAIKNK